MRLGVDVVAVAEVDASVAQFGDGYLRRVYTAAEIERCAPAGRAGVARRARLLAASFAGKEAVIKALGPLERPPWRDIEVRLAEPGSGHARSAVALSGAAAVLAVDEGIERWHLSTATTRGLATAFVVAQQLGDR